VFVARFRRLVQVDVRELRNHPRPCQIQVMNRELGLALLGIVLTLAEPLRADPGLRVRGGVRFEASATVAGGRTLLVGTLVDDTGRPVSEGLVRVRGMSATGSQVGLPRPDACAGSNEAGTLGPGADSGTPSLRSDSAGRFCVTFTTEARTLELRYHDPRGLLDEATQALVAEPTRQGVELRFVPSLTTLDLERELQRVEVSVRSPSPLFPGSAPLPIALYAVSARGDELLAQGTCPTGASTALTFASSRIKAPGPLELAARFGGSDDLQPAEARIRLVATTRVRLALSRTPERADPTDGIALDVALASPIGAVSTGSVEARLAGHTVGIARVDRGSAQVVARFARRGSHAELELRYLPSEPWWVPGQPLSVTAELAPRGRVGSWLWLVAITALGLWLVRGWRRPPRAPRAPPTLTEGRRAPAAAVVVVEANESFRGWSGTVNDAHEATPIAGAEISLFGPKRVLLARTTSDALGNFELSSTEGADLVFSASSRWHSEFTCPAPPLGRLRVDLVSRRRNLLLRLVRWAERRGPMGRGLGEPTPAEVVRQARRSKRPDVAEWAGAVEDAAFGPAPVDDRVESEVLTREPPDGAPPVPRR
jgi:hypothetical protein